MRRAIFLALLTLCANTAMAAPAAVLEKVVILQRHGVRSPTKAPAELASSAAQPWASWPVAPGELTTHGRDAVRRMGEALHQHYAALLKRGGCGAVFVWADNADQRTRESGQAMAETLAPGCGATAQSAPAGRDDPLFHGDALCPADADAAKAAVAARLDGVIAAQRAAYDKARLSLAAILTPDLKAESCQEGAECGLLSDRNGVKAGGKLSGTLADAASLSENLFLEYAQGMTQPGWGRIPDAAALAAFMPLHNISSNLTRRTPLLAAHNGSLLARQIENLLAAPRPFGAVAPIPEAARLVVLLGHDTNLSNLGSMLGIDWRLPGEPDDTAPDTALAFELWRAKNGARFVRLEIYYQTPDQLRDLTHFDAAHPPPHLSVMPAACSKEECTVAQFTGMLDAAIVPECLSAR